MHLENGSNFGDTLFENISGEAIRARILSKDFLKVVEFHGQRMKYYRHLWSGIGSHYWDI